MAVKGKWLKSRKRAYNSMLRKLEKIRQEREIADKLNHDRQVEANNSNAGLAQG